MAMLKDGYQTVITFADQSGVLLYLKSLTPPGIDAGGEIDITTMSNTAWRTMWGKSLKTATPLSLNAAYDTAVLDQIISMAGNNQLITITFSDNSTWAFYGIINEFTPGELTEGEHPTADLTVIPTNLNGSDVETAPDYTAP